MKKKKQKKFTDYLTLKEKRFVAFFIDCFVSVLIPFIPALILESIQSFSDPETEMLLGLVLIICILLGFLYLYIRDIVGSQSIGKRFTKIKVVKSDGNKASLISIILHDITVIIYPVEALLLLISGKTLGERLSGTILIEVKH